MLKYQNLIDQMTLEEKAGFCSGKDFWHLKSIERLGIPEIMVCDGPHGLRKQNAENNKVGITNSYPATCFPTAVTTACSWDPELTFRMGQALAEECIQHGVSVILGPGANMKRSPLCGRNFEYFSEDPELAGEMAAGWIKGVQSKGIGTSLKHFAANSQETNRMVANSVVDERALREIYLRAFEKAVKNGKPRTVMNAYNLVNGDYCSENDMLQNRILRDEWGFDGMVVSDWGAVNERVKGLINGNDLEMPSSGGVNDRRIVEAVENGTLDEAVLDKRVDKVLDVIFKGNEAQKKGYKYDVKAHNNLAEEIARQSIVLLKNEENILPLERVEGKYVAVIGEMADSPRYQGAGSSIINPTMVESGIRAFNNSPIDFKYSKGYDRKGKNSDKYIREAVEIAKGASKVVIFVGLTEEYESEGFDRKNMMLPDNHNKLVNAVCDVNDNVIVVLQGGSPVELPWLYRVKALVNSYLGGQAVAQAVVDILTGKCNPCGKLAETYPYTLEDTPTANRYPLHDKNIEYSENIFIGYRYYDKVNRNVRFPFGFGLSYTSFEYSDLKIKKKNYDKGEAVSFSFTIKNTGTASGAEIAQIYIAKKDSKIFRAPKELKAFKKINLKPCEEQKITIELDERAFSYWNIDTDSWAVENGEYELLVGASSRDIKLAQTIKIKSDDILPSYPKEAEYYLDGDPAKASKEQFAALFKGEVPYVDEVSADSYNNTIEKCRDKGFAKVIYNGVDIAMKPFGGMDNSMIVNTLMQTPIRNYICMSGGLFTEEMADGLLKLFEGKDVADGVGKLAKGVPNALINLKDLLNSI